jgi:D-arabinan endo alpha-(1,5)-arabinofuranosidase
VKVEQTALIAKITGPGSVNHTDRRFAVHGTDLGILWDGGDGRVFALFGDTFGEGWGGDGGGPNSADWRCNFLAFSRTRDLSRGLVLDEVVPRKDGTAAQVIPRDRWRDEVTVIPNTGIAVDGAQYVQYMSVREWGPPGRWHTNYGGIAVSRDGGVNWDKPRRARWPNRSGRDDPFQLGAFARDGDHVYLFGTTNGRHGDAHLARVEAPDVLKASAYEYFTGSGWARDEFAAVAVLPGPVGELSVAYSVHWGQWLAMHLDDPGGAILVHTADRLEGPWSAGEVAVPGARYPGLYGGYLHPWALDGPDIYYLMSQWGPYNVFLMRSRLAPG